MGEAVGITLIIVVAFIMAVLEFNNERKEQERFEEYRRQRDKKLEEYKNRICNENSTKKHKTIRLYPNITITNCKNCGAPIKSKEVQCSYCGTVYGKITEIIKDDYKHAEYQKN